MSYLVDDIAIVGLSLRLPGGTEDPNTFWKKLRSGESAIRKLSEDELDAAGVPAHLHKRSDYVPYAAPLDDFDHFDAEFFGLSPKEAGIMDPQHRVFLELAWEALEAAGHPPFTFPGKVGVYAGSGMGSYFYFNVCSNPDLVDETGMFLLRHTGNDKDFLSTRVSHALDLKGPSINIQTACSTSLVAVHYAAQALRLGECDIALAGGSTIELPQGHGYLFKENEILSPDGQCRAFDHRAEGTVFGSGAGIVALRRMSDAMRDGDPILAVLKGSAINNDGADKAGYLAPSVSGQAAAIRAAHAEAGVSAETIDYVECHGTGTFLGDPIEVAALTEAFRSSTDKTDFCRIGSVKTNIGHLDTAAGIASLAKTALALHHGEIPPSLGFEKPNPAIDFKNSPFRVNDMLTDWPEREHLRRAAVNSLGVGGTNAHAILEEAPARSASEDSAWPFQLLTLSARSDAALDAASEQLATYLETNQSENLADVAFTLKEGRHGFDRRRVVVANTHAEAARLLRDNNPRRVFSQQLVSEVPGAVFMFPGGGAQYAGMARDLYNTEPVFRDWMDKGLDILQPKLDYDVRAIWLPEDGDLKAADEKLKTPSVQLPLIMIVEYALAQLWMSWGVTPSALTGHSMGENTAACLAGVMSFEDCIGLVHLRGSLFDHVPGGGMLSVALSEDDLRSHLVDELDIAAVNAPGLSVATGPVSALESLEQRLKLADIDCHRIAINVAAHSRMLEPILEDFEAYLNSITLSAPQIPFVSNVTGDWITEAEATSPRYWVRHLRSVVRFADGISTLAAQPDQIFIEVGPGRAMAALAAQCVDVNRNQVLGTLRDPSDEISDDVFFVTMLGRLWAMGGQFDWNQLWDGAERRRVVLPTYPFQRKQYFIEPGVALKRDSTADWLMRIEEAADWGWKPYWKPTYADCLLDVTSDLASTTPETWLIFLDDTGLGADLVARIRAAGHRVITVTPGEVFGQIDKDAYSVAPALEEATYETLFASLSSEGLMPTRIVHLWMVTEEQKPKSRASALYELQQHGFWSLFHIMRARSAFDEGPLHINVITSGAMQVAAEPLLHPAKALVLGPARVIPREFPDVTCGVLDVTFKGKKERQGLVDALLEDCFATPSSHVAALRGNKRSVQTFKQAPLTGPQKIDMPDNPVVLITGGLGGIGLTLARQLVEAHGARIAFVSRQPVPPRAEWDTLLSNGTLTGGQANRLRALSELEAAGATFLTLQADVSNPESMRDAVTRIIESWGSITGVIHAGGVIDDAPILAKTSESVDKVMSAKVQGTDVLLDLFPDGSLDWMALFSSTSTVTAPAGQVDYVAANEYLNAVAHARQGGKTRVFAVNWGVWSDVGMAADAMAARTQDGDVAPTLLDVPMLDAVSEDATGARRFTAQWRTSEQWVLDEHRTRAGDALLPGTGYLELAAEVLSTEGLNRSFELRDLTFFTPLRVEDTGSTDVQISLKRADTHLEFEVSSAAHGQAFENHAEAKIRTLPMIPPARLDLEAIKARCPRHLAAKDGETLRPAQAAHLKFGPQWRVLKDMRFGQGEGLARMCLPRGEEAYQLHPGLLDIATGWAMDLIKGYIPDQFWVPVSYNSFRFFKSLPRELISWVRYVPDGSDSETARFDITLAAPDGDVAVEIEGFTIHRLDKAMAFADSASPSAAAERRQPEVIKALSPAEERLHHNIGQGISANEGAAAFFKVLGGDAVQQIVSSLDLPGLIRQAERDADPVKTMGQAFDRPDLEIEYIAPEGPIEQQLADFWTDLLGISKVGAEDDFFDLGGHSLIAVRFFAKVKSAFSVDFPISVLFEAPTIRSCAALIAERVGPIEETPSSRGAVAPSFTHVVPMSKSPDAEKTPLFMVAGMYGNVLNFRSLVQLLGNDRQYFGLQAGGVSGKIEPHESIVEAARDYIAEMREICPMGPYLLGGYSGGGLTALEIAHQLEAEGEEVSKVFLIDIPPPTQPTLTRLQKIKLRLKLLQREKFAFPVNQARHLFKKYKAYVAPREQEPLDRKNKIGQAFVKAARQHTPKSWDGPTVLFRPPLHVAFEIDAEVSVNENLKQVRTDNFWSGLLTDLEIIEVPGDHVSMMLEPNIRVLANRMCKQLETLDSPKTAARDLQAAE